MDSASGGGTKLKRGAIWTEFISYGDYAPGRFWAPVAGRVTPRMTIIKKLIRYEKAEPIPKDIEMETGNNQ